MENEIELLTFDELSDAKIASLIEDFIGKRVDKMSPAHQREFIMTTVILHFLLRHDAYRLGDEISNLVEDVTEFIDIVSAKDLLIKHGVISDDVD